MPLYVRQRYAEKRVVQSSVMSGRLCIETTPSAQHLVRAMRRIYMIIIIIFFFFLEAHRSHRGGPGRRSSLIESGQLSALMRTRDGPRNPRGHGASVFHTRSRYIDDLPSPTRKPPDCPRCQLDTFARRRETRFSDDPRHSRRPSPRTPVTLVRQYGTKQSAERAIIVP